MVTLSTVLVYSGWCFVGDAFHSVWVLYWFRFSGLGLLFVGLTAFTGCCVVVVCLLFGLLVYCIGCCMVCCAFWFVRLRWLHYGFAVKLGWFARWLGVCAVTWIGMLIVLI